MESWDVSGLDVEAHKPRILASGDAARVIALQLPAGETLQEHEVHERTWLVVLEGQLEILAGESGSVTGSAGMLAEFAPGEAHEVRAKADTRLLLFLAPWPGDGHPGAMSLEEKAHVRERASERAES
ncbi:MAG: cupin domain-containing protein [Thermoleophilaceae bacterium]|nr:cupin domain-containing protein [Thermoleophilaceae bacterium]